MRIELINIDNVEDDINRQIAGASDIELVEANGKTYLVVSGAVDSGLSLYEILNDGTLVPVSDVLETLSSGTVGVSDVTVIEVNGKSIILPSGNFDNNQVVYELTLSGTFAVTDSYSDLTGQYQRWLLGETAEYNGTQYFISVQWDTPGFTTYELFGDQLGNPVPYADTPGLYLGDVSAVEAAQFHGKTFLFVASGLDAGLHTYEMTPTGGLTMTYTLPPSEGGFSGVSDLSVIDTGARKFLILASSGTDSLLVYRVSQGGKLQHVDTLTDTAETRFADVQIVEAFTYDGRDFVLAAGSDQGMTLMEIDYRGRLKVLETLVDTPSTHLRDITGISVYENGGQVYVYVSSSTENGVSAFALDLPNGQSLIRGTPDEDTLNGTSADDTIFGHGKADVLFGHGGNDRLIDGLGPDEMWGGAGADIFEFVPDNRTDRIMDFELGLDVIDLNGYPVLFNIADLDITATATGAIIDVQGDIIRIFSDDGNTINPNQFTQDDFIFG